MMIKLTVLTGIVIEENTLFSLSELSHSCGKPDAWILTLVEEGIIEPAGTDQTHWQFSGQCLRRVRIVQRLESDLGLNLAGAALALELLEEIELLRNRIAILEK